ncbi:cbb3-type cytochrome c oxidase subunit II [Alcaligenes ammonioxydans]|jgi:cytochrome c oxidase cbb3-type subunit 2|uniref:Cytochrome-c oxidase n=1 Tax=Alcaligenes ammonioxydans TaxID=2582914 RepID=A0ABX8SRI6_9BURK|nr:cbb3-type cytochrome c oxidase subunit II [Alcaligenes ammonioxydans]EJC63313.1 cytochrome C oxidase, mono-heme subunit [Alcaligenes faecalis subsp. faecalis NCIB 8687]QBH20583.1 cytochrome-c oxidase [Alcaligenes faecalis]MCH1880488.1 cbb3-type cytochrome c oxidase subunit II [Alcaligenes ammonioxydans]QXX78656.1 cytochrome-c oxidase [Alcaligenes ammonioxydans]WGQ36785.1 cbb3-type cytochrome c oxidase subunit II [Alcaligenes faecalis]
MNRLLPLLIGAIGVLLLATLMLVILPAWQLRTSEPPAPLKPYTVQQLQGRDQYVANGCLYCHSQQPRSSGQTLFDTARGWGRASTPGDYFYDSPHLLGTMRTGPDLFNVAARMKSRDWHLTHLYQPRAIFDWSLMPSYPYMFELKAQLEPGDVLVRLPESLQPEGKHVVARQEALDLVEYLLALDRTYATTSQELDKRDRGYDRRPGETLMDSGAQ